MDGRKMSKTKFELSCSWDVNEIKKTYQRNFTISLISDLGSYTEIPRYEDEEGMLKVSRAVQFVLDSWQKITPVNVAEYMIRLKRLECME